MRSAAQRIQRTHPIYRTSQILLRRHKTALADVVHESVVNSVKSSLLQEASQPDSRLWNADSSIDQENLYLQGSLRYNDNNTTYSSVNNNTVNPAEMCREELSLLVDSITNDLLGTDHPVLNQAATYFFQQGGKKIRPMMVLLLSRALAGTSAVAEDDTSSSSLLVAPQAHQRPDLPQAQRRLAEISEVIHTASLFHDDVIDKAATRRNVPAVHVVFGNKMAILAGDYLLARASISLARLRDARVIETMSTIIEHLVRGEVMQMRPAQDEMSYYLRKNFYKTGSLMANSCKATALLGSYEENVVEACYDYGKHVGMAFQLVDDVLDFSKTSATGKPTLNDLQSGLATAPVLLAAQEFPQLHGLIQRQFGQPDDVAMALEWVQQSQGLERTQHLAQLHAERAMDALSNALEPSLYLDALLKLAHQVVTRNK